MAKNRSSGKGSRALVVALGVGAAIGLAPVSPASAHVHGITPLRCVGTANDGAVQTDVTPAGDSDGPISGLIPKDVGNSPLAIGDGGFDTPACPVP